MALELENTENNTMSLDDVDFDQDEDFLFDDSDLEMDNAESDEELELLKNNAMMLGNFIESVHEELYADHRLSEVIELFATMASISKKYGDPFENQHEIEEVLGKTYSPEEVVEFVDVMQSFQELGNDSGLTSLDGSPFKLQNLSDDLIEDLFAEAIEIAKEEDEESGQSFEEELVPLKLSAV